MPDHATICTSFNGGGVAALATVSDTDPGTELTYMWYVDGTQVESRTTTSTSNSYSQVFYGGSHTVEVTVTGDAESDSASTGTFYVKGGGCTDPAHC